MNFIQRATVTCQICSEATISIHTKLCDRCYELSTRMNARPSIVIAILEKDTHAEFREKILNHFKEDKC